jgi:Phycobilisome Linker polypeptide
VTQTHGFKQFKQGKGARMTVADQYLAMARELTGSRVGGFDKLTAPSPFAQPEAYGRDRLGTAVLAENPKVVLKAPYSESDVQGALCAIYRQIFGNTYVMESERPIIAESQLRNGELTVRGFVRNLAKSEVYKTRFFYNNSQNRAIELNHKLLLGRAPHNQKEISQHLDLYQNQGYDAEIDSYLDSDEYLENFGEDTVPYFRGFNYQVGQWSVGYSRLFTLYDGHAGSDTNRAKEGLKSRLSANIALKKPTEVARPRALQNVWKDANPNFGYISETVTPKMFGLAPFLEMARQLAPKSDMQASDSLQISGDFMGDRVQRLASEYAQPSAYQQTDTYGQERIRVVGALEVPRVMLRAPFSESEVQGALYAIYRQIFGNTYVMESERPIIAESQLRNGELTVRGFVRNLVKSEVYKTRFFYKNSQNRAIELSHKLLLGRAPYDQKEISYHLDLYESQGYDAEMDSYLDSEEYLENFGEDTVPYFRGFKYQVGQSAEGFNWMRRLYDGWAGSDTDRGIGRQQARLSALIPRAGSNLEPFIAMANALRGTTGIPSGR